VQKNAPLGALFSIALIIAHIVALYSSTAPMGKDSRLISGGLQAAPLHIGFAATADLFKQAMALAGNAWERR
jgi:hypothetical protein